MLDPFAPSCRLTTTTADDDEDDDDGGGGDDSDESVHNLFWGLALLFCFLQLFSFFFFLIRSFVCVPKLICEGGEKIMRVYKACEEEEEEH